jgi:hypothetical protein
MTARFRTELDRYLDDEYVLVKTDNFKILDWWKVAGTRYPTLTKIARDIFAIPISTVASESAFSTSGRVLSGIVVGLLWRSWRHLCVPRIGCGASI